MRSALGALSTAITAALWWRSPLIDYVQEPESLEDLPVAGEESVCLARIGCSQLCRRWSLLVCWGQRWRLSGYVVLLELLQVMAAVCLRCVTECCLWCCCMKRITLIQLQCC